MPGSPARLALCALSAWLAGAIPAQAAGPPAGPAPARLWSIPLEGWSGQARPLATDGRLVFHPDLPGLTARDGRSGKRVWRLRDLGEEACADEVLELEVAGGSLLALFECRPSEEEAAAGLLPRTPRATLVALEAATGRRRWEIHGAIPAPVGLLDGRVLLVQDGRPTALDLGTGRTAWQAQEPGELWEGPALGAACAVFQTEAGEALAFEAATGKARWRAALPGTPRAPAAASGGVLLVVRLLRGGAGDRAQEPQGSLLAGLDLATGRVLWRRELPGELAFTAPVPAGARAFLLTEGADGPGRLHALDPATGADSWSAAVDCSLSHDCTPALGPRGVLTWTARVSGQGVVPDDDELWLELRALETGALLGELRVQGEEKLGLSRVVVGRGFLALSPGERLLGFRPRGAWRKALE
jgi:outer membrane protein assembly factor BamB